MKSRIFLASLLGFTFLFGTFLGWQYIKVKFVMNREYSSLPLGEAALDALVYSSVIFAGSCFIFWTSNKRKPA